MVGTARLALWLVLLAAVPTLGIVSTEADLTLLDAVQMEESTGAEMAQWAPSDGEAHKALKFSAELSAGNVEKVFYKGDKQEESVEELGELLMSRHSSEEAEHEAVNAIKKQKADVTNAQLFDLVPLFKGIVADPIRSRGLVKNCVNGLHLWVQSEICKERAPPKKVKKTKPPEFKNTTSSSNSTSNSTKKSDTFLGESLLEHKKGKKR
jgi:hypothetical protein